MSTTTKQQIAQEIVHLMSNRGPFPGLWTGEPMTADQVIEEVEQHHCLPMLDGHTKNSLGMQNVRKSISRRVAKLRNA